MRPSSPLLILLLASALLPLTPSPAQAGACLGEAEPKPLMRHVLGIKYGDWGIEHQMDLGACVPLVTDRGPLLDLSKVEVGVTNYFSPIYSMPAGYVHFQPLSFLSVRVEAGAIFYWPIGVASAGYYGISDYEQDYTKKSLPADEGEAAFGHFVRIKPALQLAFPIGPARMIVLDSLSIDYFQIGGEDFYFHNKHDLPAANSEWFIDNLALVMVGIRVHPNAELRLGVNDQLTMNLGGKSTSNAIRGVAMIALDHLGRRIRDFTPILTMGGRTHHPMRRGDFNFIAAVSMSIDLSRLEPRADDGADATR